MPLDPRRLWAVELAFADRSGLVELGVEEVFVRALVKRLRAGPADTPPALAVLPTADEALTEAGWPF